MLSAHSARSGTWCSSTRTHPLSSHPPFSPLHTHMHKSVIKSPKPSSEGQHPTQTPGCCVGQGAPAFSSCCNQRAACDNSSALSGVMLAETPTPLPKRCSRLASALVIPSPRGVRSRSTLLRARTPEQATGSGEAAPDEGFRLPLGTLLCR